MKKIGHLELIFGSMYCGKSEELIRRLKRAKIAGYKCQLFKPSMDDRYANNHIFTHDTHENKELVKKMIEDSIGKCSDEVINDIVTKLSNAMSAQSVKDSAEIMCLIEDDVEVVGIDEVQFFDDNLINVVKELISKGKIVIASGLDMYASGEPFGNVIPYLACIAKYIDKLHAVCLDCGNEAVYSHMLENTGNTDSKVEIGSKGKYIALCESCRVERMN